jgi:hypothetical protein
LWRTSLINSFVWRQKNAHLREVAKSSTEQLEKANKLATEAQGKNHDLEERAGSTEGKDEGGGAVED